MIQNKIQIDEKDFEFIQKAYKLLSYNSLRHYMREAIQDKVRKDRKKLRALQRSAVVVGGGVDENRFESLEEEDFDNR
jgi:hypothetical protein